MDSRSNEPDDTEGRETEWMIPGGEIISVGAGRNEGGIVDDSRGNSARSVGLLDDAGNKYTCISTGELLLHGAARMGK